MALFPRDGVDGDTSSYLGKGCRITGTVEVQGVTRIEGDIEGTVIAAGRLILGETAVLKAKINGVSIVVHGRVTGDLVASERLEIRPPSVVVGDVSAPSLVVHEGAVLEGRCTMNGAAAGRGAVAGRGAAPAAPPV
jgi:cytoskeletal protein CcmA (bactofilin family)